MRAEPTDAIHQPNSIAKDAEILIVEDENIVALDIKGRLESLGYGVSAIASSGEQAIEQALIRRPDLALMDIRLKGVMDGVETAKQMRTRFNVPVVYLTAYVDEHTMQRAKETEPLGYLLKPFGEKELNVTIKMALHKHKGEQELRERDHRLSAALDSMSHAVIGYDNSSMVTFMNPSAEAFTGWSQKEALGKPFKEIFHTIEEVSQPQASSGYGDITSGWAQRGILISRNKRHIPFESKVAPIKDNNGNTTGVILVFRDITERKRLQKQILEISEQEQRRIGQDLHDTLCQHLVGIEFMSKALEKKLSNKNLPDTAEDAARITKLINQGTLFLRDLTSELYPLELEANGLIPALHKLAGNTQRMFNVSCQFQHDTALEIDNVVTAMQLYRIAQEAVHNAIKHGKASHISLSLAAGKNRHTLIVKDNGIGLPKIFKTTKGMGSHIMKHRAQTIGGSLLMHRGPEGGTVVSCVFPNAIEEETVPHQLELDFPNR